MNDIRRVHHRLVIRILALATTFALPHAAHAGGVVGTGTAASCTEAAFTAAIAGGGTVTFNCGASATITLTSPKDVTSDLEIDGGGKVTISGGGNVAHFVVHSGNYSLTVRNLRLADGHRVGGSGGSIAGGGYLTVSNCEFSGNVATGNDFTPGDGGAIATSGPLTITDSTFTDNEASDLGGAVSAGGPTIITGSTFSGNRAVTYGGAVAGAHTFTITNTTFVNNTALFGGAFDNGNNSSPWGTASLTNCTFAGNTAGIGGGAIGPSGTVTLTNSIVESSPGVTNCDQPVDVNGGHNLDSDGTCGVGAPTIPRLAPEGLADNGGPTRTVALCTAVDVPSGCAGASPAINAGDQGVCSATGVGKVNNLDQRGYSRPGSGATKCSIGAYEAAAPQQGCTNGLPCRAAVGVCDAPEFCTNSVCPGDAKKADGTPCDDGVFCNGADSCNVGECTDHPGDPCAEDGLTCSEEESACLSIIPVCGDVSNDGSLTTSDSLRVLRSSVGVEGCDLEVCDYNGDSNITASDALAVLRAAVGNPGSPRCPGGRAELVVVGTTVDLSILADYGIETDGLVVSTLISESELAAGATSTHVEFADSDNGQILFVSDAGDKPFIVAWFSAEEIAGGSVTISPTAIARGVIWMTPLLIGYSLEDRMAILAIAESDGDFQTLVGNIETALASEPGNLLEEAVFPEIYTEAIGLVIDALESSPLAANRLAARRSVVVAAAPAPVVGTSGAPYFADKAGAAILAADPTMLFYGLEIEGKGTYLLAGKDTLWEWQFGWPPAGFTEPTTQEISLGDGNFNAHLSKFGLHSEAAMKAASANLLRASCDLIDVLFWCPASNSYIKRYLDRAPIPAQLATLATDAFDDKIGISTPDNLFSKIVDMLTDESVWRDVTEILYASAADKARAVRFLQGTKSILKSASKILVAYDAANVYLPFAWDLITKPRNLDFCLKQTAGTLSSTCQSTPPDARITAISTPQYVGVQVQLDASQSTDAETMTSQLQVRWDFDADGIFDTAWSTTKSAAWTYSNVGLYSVLLEVKDLDGLVGTSVRNVFIESNNAGGGATHIKVFRNYLPWESTAFESTMEANGYTEGPGEQQYEILPSSAFATEVLEPGVDMVVIMNDQDQLFYDDLADSLDRIERFAAFGGVLVWEAADKGWNEGSMALAGIAELPAGVNYAARTDNYNYNVYPESTLMAGLPSWLYGNFASHEYFYDLPPGAIVYMEDSLGFVTLVEYNYGDGWILLTGQPLEHSVRYWPNDMGRVYERMFNFVLGRATGSEPAVMEDSAPRQSPSGSSPPSAY